MSKNKRKYFAPTYERKFIYSTPTYEKGFYAKMSEFRYNNSRDGGRHPNYVFGLTPDDRYYSLGITTNPPKSGTKAKYKYQKLHNKVDPNPKNNKPDYICTNNVHHNTTESYGKVKEGWKFSKEDKKIVDGIIKKHKQILEKQENSKHSKKTKKNRK